MSDLADLAEYDGDFWVLFQDFPLFSDCEVKYEYDFATEDFVHREEPSTSDTTVRVIIEGELVTPEQEEAWRSLLSDLPNLRLSTLQALALEGRAIADRLPKVSAARKELYFSPQGILGMVAFSGINIHQRQPDGHAWISLDFSVGWDDEHGASVLWGPHGVEAVGGCAEFTCRGNSVAAHAAYCR